MNITQQFITIITFLVSIHTAAGVLLHDTSLDKVFISSLKNMNHAKYSQKSDTIKLPDNNPHTHPEHVQLTNILKNGTSQPRTAPRNHDRKYLQQKRVARGSHMFGGYRVLLDEYAEAMIG